jgi:hypothetical protein
MTITNSETYSEQGVNLQTLVLIQGIRTKAIDAPQMLLDKASLNIRKLKVDASLSHISISVRGEEIYRREKNKKQSDREWEKILDHVRHDYVGSLLQDETDADLTKFGYDTKLTPDVVSSDGRIILELATTLSEIDATKESSYKKKVLNYKDLCSKYSITPCIIVVSSSSVYTNCFLRSEMVSELCRRLREARSIESYICDQTGYMPNSSSDDSGDGVLDVMRCLELMKKLKRKEDWDFNSELADESRKEITEEDEKEVERIMSGSWEEVCKPEAKVNIKDIHSYRTSLSTGRVTCKKKRVINPPCMFPPRTKQPATGIGFSSLLQETSTNDEWEPLLRLWKEGISNMILEQKENPPPTQEFKSMQEAMNPSLAPQKHHVRKMLQFEDCLTDSQRDHIALSGPGAKLRSEMDDITEHQLEGKLSFSINAPVDDIENFINGEGFTGSDNSCRENSTCHEIVDKSFKKRSRRDLGTKLFNWCSDLAINRYSSFISELCLEMSYEYKTPNLTDSWTCKPMRCYDALLLCRSTGTHIFYSICLKKDTCKEWDTGRLGAETYEFGNYIISDFGSMVEATLEHFMKAGPYMTSISAYLMQHFKVPFVTKKIELPKSFWQCLKTMFLVYFNNKVDTENLIMDLRYLYMRVLQEFENDPFHFIDRLPTVLRSRLSVYLLNKVWSLMKSLRVRPIRQIRIRTLPESDPNSVQFVGLKTIFHDDSVSLDQLVDSFYFSYTVSKQKGRVGDRSFKIVSKIIKEEMWARENIREVKSSLWSPTLAPTRQHWSSALLKKMVDNCKTKWKSIHGENVISQLNRKIAVEFSRKSFAEIASLKASSKDHENPQINLIPDSESHLTGKAYVQRLKELNPKMEGKRPRVMSSLFKLIKQFCSERADEEPTMLKVLNYSLEKLVERGYIYSDCFPKDQHGGDREIHVLEIKARVVQFFVERSAACMSHLLTSDSILNPKYKDKFMKQHELHSQATLGDHMTMCKSADATKWCQRHHVSKFFFLMNRLTDGYWEDMYYSVFQLWTTKRIAIPEDLIAILHTSQFADSDNEPLLWLRKKFLSGQLPFVCEDSDTIEVKYGMWQGIWHKVSTVFHSVVQDFYTSVCRSALKSRGFDNVISVIQGSDDSAACISYSRKGKKADALMHLLLKWKEDFQKWVSIWPSSSKSSIGTKLLIEYNSEWWYRGKVMKPTFRWVSACLQTTIVEAFYERVQIFYNELTTAVEMGLSTLAASVVQRCQALLHYSMMGFSNHILRERIKDLLLEYPHPSFGFFPLDGEEHCGVTGFDFALFCLMKEHGLRLQEYSQEMVHPRSLLDYDEKIDSSLKKDLRSANIGYGNKKLWQRVVDEIDIGELEDALKIMEEDPTRLYRRPANWQDERMWMIFKLFQKGVRTSLSLHSPTIRSASSSSYIFNRACISLRKEDGRLDKMSLMKAIIESKSTAGGRSVDKGADGLLFINEKEFGEFYDYLQELRKGFSFQEVSYGRHSKVSVPVWGDIHLNDIPLLDIVKRALFQMTTIPISRTAFKLLWNECKAKYRFLRDTYAETLEASGMDHMQIFDFFNSVESKTRKLTLQDSTVKSPHLISSLTRIFWPQVKVRTNALDMESTTMATRHMMFCILTFPFSLQHRRKVISAYSRSLSFLTSPITKSPMRLRKIKMILRFLQDSRKDIVLRDMPLVKNGTLGFLVERQRRLVREDGQVRYRGRGVWAGEVCGISCRVIMSDDYVDKIEIKALHDTMMLSKRLGLLIEELKLKRREHPDRSNSLYYLNENSHFAASPLPLTLCVPVELETDMTPLDMSAITNKPWDVDFDQGYMRMFYYESQVGSYSRDRKITIVSEVLTSRDWSPELTPSSAKWSGSKVFIPYCKGESVGLLDLMSDIGISPDRSHMQDILDRSADGDVSLGIYGTQMLSRSLTGFIFQARAKEMQKELFLNRQRKLNVDSSLEMGVHDEQVEEFMKLADRETDFSKPLMSWADEMEEHIRLNQPEERFMDEYDAPEATEDFLDETMIKDEFWTADSELLREISELFYSHDIDASIVGTGGSDLNKIMPLENEFWLDTLLVVESEPQGKECIEKLLNGGTFTSQDRLLSHAAFVMSLVTKSNLYPSTEGRLTFEQETILSSSTKEPLSSPEDVIKHIMKLKQTLKEIEESWSSAGPIVQDMLDSKRKITVMQLEAYERNEESYRISGINYYRFMGILLQCLRKEEVYDKSYQSTDLESLVTLLISDVLEFWASKYRSKEMSEKEFNDIRSRIWDRIISESLVRWVAESMNVGLVLEVSGGIIFSHYPKFSNKEITLEIPLSE